MNNRKLSALIILAISLPSSAAPRLSFKEPSFDFGKVFQSSKVEHTFEFTNEGDEKLRISSVIPSCGCTAVILTTSEAFPGETGEIKAALDTELKEGKTVKTISVSSNDPEGEKKIFLHADVVPLPSHDRQKPEGSLFSPKCNSCHGARGEGKTGMELYQAVCAMCHGVSFEGGAGPAFKSKNSIYSKIYFGTKSPMMPGFSRKKGGPLTDAQIRSLTALLRVR